MALGLWPALELGEGRGSIVHGACCGAPLLIRVPSPRLEFMRSIRGSWVYLGCSQVCTCVSVPYIYGCMHSCISYRASLWGNVVLGGADGPGGARLQAGTRLLCHTGTLCVHLILCQPGLSQEQKNVPNPKMFLGQEKPFPPCCNHRVAQLSASRSHPCPQIQHCAHPCPVPCAKDSGDAAPPPTNFHASTLKIISKL